jgi:hypothetical protein
MANQKVAARLQVGPSGLLFFIDETGQETFADKNYPVFGLGGCELIGGYRHRRAVARDEGRAFRR